MKYAKWVTWNDPKRGASAFRAELRAGENGLGRIRSIVLYDTRSRKSVAQADRLMRKEEATAEKQGVRIVGKVYAEFTDDEMANSEVARMGYFDSTAATGLAQILPSPYLYVDAVKV